MAGFTLLVLACFIAVAGAVDFLPGDLEARLRMGDWNQRIDAVNQLGQRGAANVGALGRALKDPDWQVRLTAVHWLGRLGPDAVRPLGAAMAVETCPLVRLALVNKLGGLGHTTLSLARPKGEKGIAACKSWTFPITEEYIHSRDKKSRKTEFTQIDEQGCQYVQFKRSGRQTCPTGFILQGVGDSPGDVEILRKGHEPQSGVALCCRADQEAATLAAQPPKPQKVECRLHPIECNPPWVEMEPPDGNRWSNRERRFRRNSRMRRGSMTWVHCCRPHQAAGTDYFPPAKDSLVRAYPQRTPRALWDVQEEKLADYVQEENDVAYEDFDSMPEEEIAQRALARRSVEPAPQEPVAAAPAPGAPPAPIEKDQSPPVDIALRQETFEALLDAVEREADLSLPPGEGGRSPQDRLPAPEGAPARSADAVSADANEQVRDERGSVVPGLDAPEEGRGPPEEHLARAQGLSGREALQVQGTPEILEDRGKIVRHDPLPALIESMEHEDPSRRSRAADEIGRLGPRAAEAVAVLRGALKDKNASVRSSAVLALGNITAGTDASLPELRRALRDPDIDVRYSAAQALGRLGTDASRRFFNKHMRSETRSFLRRAE